MPLRHGHTSQRAARSHELPALYTIILRARASAGARAVCASKAPRY